MHIQKRSVDHRSVNDAGPLLQAGPDELGDWGHRCIRPSRILHRSGARPGGPFASLQSNEGPFPERQHRHLRPLLTLPTPLRCMPTYPVQRVHRCWGSTPERLPRPSPRQIRTRAVRVHRDRNVAVPKSDYPHHRAMIELVFEHDVSQRPLLTSMCGHAPDCSVAPLTRDLPPLGHMSGCRIHCRRPLLSSMSVPQNLTHHGR